MGGGSIGFYCLAPVVVSGKDAAYVPSCIRSISLHVETTRCVAHVRP